ncbi:DUF1330 domain-containing protein [Maricaulis parjimensis]|uniref:DUF1330 domain-containing protein n=1 Tax=Maricaulis parjimensis TaxID=144023 RepID=UPI00193ADC47|nr:DUF1330 domain-containing protein [Maricaulis parjimensis]
MSVYVIAMLNFTDEARYRTYQAAATKLFMERGIQVLAADEAPVLLEGEGELDKVVVMKFADEAAARDFLEGPDYQAISADRRAGAKTQSVMIRGF